jgi:nucleoside-diphosphate-sugar epimerase
VNERVTVVGARGFIGSAVAESARAQGLDLVEARHDAVPASKYLGSVIYCSGVAWQADERPLDAYDRHVGAVSRILRECRYDRVVYLSSTRVYDGSNGTSEGDAIATHSDRLSDVYTISKLAGENLVLSASSENRVVRASNVYGASLRSQLFLSDILRQAASTGRVALRSALDSSKDYVSVADVATQLLRIASGSCSPVYNVAAGTNTTHRAILDVIGSVIPIRIEIAEGAPTLVVPPIDVRRTFAEFPIQSRRVLDDVPQLALAFKAAARC